MPIEALSFTPNGKTLLVGSNDRRQAWNVDTGCHGIVVEQSHGTPLLVTADDHRAIAWRRANGGVCLVSIETGAIVQQFATKGIGQLLALQLSADRKTLVTISREAKSDAVRRWSIATGALESETFVAQPRPDFVKRTGYWLHGLPLGGSRLARLEQVRPPKIRPGGSIDWGMELHLEDWATQAITNRLPLPANGRLKIAASPNPTILAAVVTYSIIPSAGKPWGSSYLLVWDATTDHERVRVRRKMDNYFAAFDQVAITPDARIAATSSHRDRIEIWDGNTGELLQTFLAGVEVTALAFSDDGRILASGHADGRISIWESRAPWQQANGSP
jgi:WD40 repeat protein